MRGTLPPVLKLPKSSHLYSVNMNGNKFTFDEPPWGPFFPPRMFTEHTWEFTPTRDTACISQVKNYLLIVFFVTTEASERKMLTPTLWHTSLSK